MLKYQIAENKPLRLDLDNTSGRKENIVYLKYICFIAIYFITLIRAQVTGIVVDETSKQPIPDVNIIVDNNGTVTNDSGEFEIQTDSRYIIFEHIAYDRKRVLINDSLYVELSLAVITNEEIIVLSSLRQESYINSVSSTSILKQKQIKYLDQSHFQNLIDYIPNLNWAGGTSRARYFQIRGIGERSQYFGEGSPNFSVSYTVDDIDLSGIGMIGGLNDIKQLEVSKGPQSTVFGNNAIGGSISFKSNDPSDVSSFSIGSKIGMDNLREYTIMANFNLFRENYLRFYAQKNNQDGFRDNKFLEKNNTNAKDESFLRMKLKLSPRNYLSIKNTVIISEMKNGYDVWAPDNNDEFNTYTDQPGEDSQKTKAFSSRAEYINDTWSLLGIISQSSSNLIHSYDGDWGNNAFWEDTTTYGFDPYYYGYYLPYQFFDKTSRNRRISTLEARLILENSILGFFTKTLSEKDDAEGWLFGGNAVEANSEHNINVNALYAQIGFKFNNKISNTTSLRYENNMIEYYGNSYGYYGSELPQVYSNESYDLIGFKSAFKYEIDSFTKAYSLVSKGYKTGGVNQQPYISNTNRNYNPEFLTNYEIGLKRISENSSFSLSSFYGLRSEQQVSVSAQQIENDPNSFYYFTANTGTGWMKGLEIEQTLNVMENLSIKYSLGYLDTWIEEFSYEIGDGLLETGGNRQASMSPKISGCASFLYKKGGYYLNLSQSFKDKYYYSDSHDNQTDAYSLINLSFGKEFKNASISIWCNNLFDKRYPVRGFYFGLIPPTYEDQLWISYGDPRQIGFSIDYIY